jgi:cephalosporin hydroxylase
MSSNHAFSVRQIVKALLPPSLLEAYRSMRKQWEKLFIRLGLIKCFHKDIQGYLQFFFHKGRSPLSGLKYLIEVICRSSEVTDISDHLIPILTKSVINNPRLIVELGVRGGGSTFVLERVAHLCDAVLVSVDIEDCSGVSAYQKWVFFQEDDIAFAREFPQWCVAKGLNPQIDLLFIDTSHLFDHTCQEIESYFPLLSDTAKVFFHDTNLKEVVLRKDGTTDMGWDNNRGVIRAIEEYLGRRFDENQPFATSQYPYLITHYPYCFGLTILEKID